MIEFKKLNKILLVIWEWAFEICLGFVICDFKIELDGSGA